MARISRWETNDNVKKAILNILYEKLCVALLIFDHILCHVNGVLNLIFDLQAEFCYEAIYHCYKLCTCDSKPAIIIYRKKMINA